ncbi:uncharacterized protein EAE98_000837 [Botrytis deweyae]|uniref:YDG domain-containing protein n=1 Tax=Botrytis deweyae TaxID=2478750 RepID=A0ABQ7IZS8_9HELO|nr:uncharacterized protein EAE98_000837 [Botrytis deweyae]KAF7938499.1 hypothetical protein EAE98_000837 [Botrytis deweyae]
MSALPNSTDLENPKVDLKAIDKLNTPNPDVAEVKFKYVESYMFRGMEFQQLAKYVKWKDDERDVYAEGHNGHVIGDWWPYPLGYQRDRAHAFIDRGTGGKAGVGAVSIVLGPGGGKNKGYENKDYGDKIFYLADNTDLMDLSFFGKNTAGTCIRVIRGANSKSIHAPPVGFRYDGLYKITVKIPIAGKSWYELERLENQKPMNKLHPTDEEVDEFYKQNSRIGVN